MILRNPKLVCQIDEKVCDNETESFSLQGYLLTIVISL